MHSHKLYINGEWVEPNSGETFPAYNPFTQEAWATISQADETDVKKAVDAARTAFETGWRHTTGLERAKMMNRLADLLEQSADRMALLESTDNGKVIRETKGQMIFSARISGSLPVMRTRSGAGSFRSIRRTSSTMQPTNRSASSP